MKTHNYRNKILCAFTLLFFMLSATAEDSLIFAIDIIRHGDRTPIKVIPKDNYIWQLGPGELTPTGMTQEYQLGQKFKSVYIDKYHLLPSTYSPQTIYVRSSDYNRTLMSAQSLLLGLYPLGSGPKLPSSNQAALPGEYQPIPVHSLPQDQDSLLIPKKNSLFESYIIQYVYNQRFWQLKQTEYKTKLRQWAQITGFKLNKLQDITGLGNALYIRQLYQLPAFPGLTDNDQQEIINLASWVSVNTYKPHPVGRYGSSQLIRQIVDYLKQASNNQSPLKYVLFSAHDSTLLSLMSSLKVPLSSPPPYASDLKILLFRSDKGDYVQLEYNGKPILLPGCDQQRCPLDKTIKLISA